jgi:predicted nucleic acid-binding protein
VSTWIANPPSWLKVVNLKTSVAAMLSYLDGGEAEAITLALEQPGTLLLMDDRHGTVEARKRGLEVVGTLAVLDRAAPAVGPICKRCLGGCARARFDPLRLMARMLEEDALRKQR